MRPLFTLILCLLVTCLVAAQEEGLTPYEIALQRIEEARVSGATGLTMVHAELTEIPLEIGLLSNLELLDLRGNHLTTLPAEIANLVQLRTLFLDNNQLNSLPSEIGTLANLEQLGLGSNFLESLPSEIGNLVSLQYFDVCFNQLNNLPSEIGNLTNLCYLDLSNNNLQSLPSELGQLTNLSPSPYHEASSGLIAYINPLTSPPLEVIAQGTPAILEYLRNPLLWHIRRFFFNWATATGGVLALFIALSWRYKFSKKKKRE